MKTGINFDLPEALALMTSYILPTPGEQASIQLFGKYIKFGKRN